MILMLFIETFARLYSFIETRTDARHIGEDAMSKEHKAVTSEEDAVIIPLLRNMPRDRDRRGDADGDSVASASRVLSGLWGIGGSVSDPGQGNFLFTTQPKIGAHK